MKNLPSTSILFYFCQFNKRLCFIGGLFVIVAGVCCLSAAYENPADSFFMFYIALAIGLLSVGLYLVLKRFGKKAYCILTPQYVQIDGQQFTFTELEYICFSTSTGDGGIVVTHAAYKRLPFLYKIIHSYALLLSAVLLAALVIYAEAWKGGVVFVCFLGCLGFFQYKNGRIYSFDCGEADKEVVEKELVSFCKTHQVILHRN